MRNPGWMRSRQYDARLVLTRDRSLVITTPAAVAAVSRSRAKVTVATSGFMTGCRLANSASSAEDGHARRPGTRPHGIRRAGRYHAVVSPAAAILGTLHTNVDQAGSQRFPVRFPCVLFPPERRATEAASAPRWGRAAFSALSGPSGTGVPLVGSAGRGSKFSSVGRGTDLIRLVVAVAPVGRAGAGNLRGSDGLRGGEWTNDATRTGFVSRSPSHDAAGFARRRWPSTPDPGLLDLWTGGRSHVHACRAPAPARAAAWAHAPHSRLVQLHDGVRAYRVRTRVLPPPARPAPPSSGPGRA